MSDNTFPQVQQAWSMFEKVTKDNAAMFEAAVDTSVVMTKASLSYAAQMSEQWGKLATEASRRFAPKA
jgi:hypothetical protein